MVTSGLIGFVLNDGKKKGTYNHMNSYPWVLGLEIMQLLKALSEKDSESMDKAVNNLKWYRYASSPCLRIGIDTTRHKSGSPTRPGSNGLQQILDRRLTSLSGDTEFQNDKMGCQWCYWIDFQKRTLRVEGEGEGWVDETRSFHELGTKFMLRLQWEVTEQNADMYYGQEYDEKLHKYPPMGEEDRDKWLDGHVVIFEKNGSVGW